MDGVRLQTSHTHAQTAAGGKRAGDRLIVLLAAALMAAIAVRFYASNAWCVACAAAFLPFCLIRCVRLRALILALFFCAGLLVCDAALEPLRAAQTQRERRVSVSALVTCLETMDDAQTRVTLEDVVVDGERFSGAYSLWMDWEAPLPARYDRIEAECDLRVKNVYGNAGGEYVLMENTRRNTWIYFSNADIQRAQQAPLRMGQRVRFGFSRLVESVRARIDTAVFENVPQESCAALCYGMLVGDSSYVDEETYAVFRDGGILHLLAVSGLHIGAAAAALAFLIGKIPLPRIVRVLLCCLIVGFYVCVCGASVSARRAAVFFAVASFAPMLLRRADGLCSLSAAAILILIFDPLALFGASFRLSFGAAGAIVMLARGWSQRFGAWLSRIHPLLAKAAPVFAVSLAAQAGVMPCMLSVSGKTPLSAFVINPIVVPCAGLILACSWLTVLFDLLGFLAPVWGRLCSALFSAVVSLTRFASRILPDLALPFWPPFVLRALFFALLFFLGGDCLLSKRRKRVIRAALCTALALGCVCLSAAGRMRERMTMFDVGQGQCVLIQTGGENILVDCGTSEYGGIRAQTLCAALRRSGAGHIDALILSHADADHINLAAEVMQTLRVDTLVCGEEAAAMLEGFSCGRIDSGGAGERVFAGGRVRILRGSGGKDNDESFVVQALVGQTNVLMMGDAGCAVETRLSDAALRSCDVLVVGHHGADTATCDRFVSALGADTALISAGRANAYGHPSETVVRRLRRTGMEIFCTKECGMIDIDGRGGIHVFYQDGYPFEGGTRI